MEPARKVARMDSNPDMSALILESLTEIKAQNSSIIEYLKSMDQRLQALETTTIAGKDASPQERCHGSGPIEIMAPSTSVTVGKDPYMCAKTLSEFLNLAPWISVASEGPDLTELVCDVCFEAKDIKGGSFIIKTDRNNLETSVQSKQFRNFKTTVSRHASNAKHIGRLADALGMDRQVDTEEEQIGLILGSVAYSTLKTYKSMCNYETQVTCLADFGVNVGDINHSRRFPESMRFLFYKVLLDRTKEVLRTPLKSTFRASPFTIWVDKITPNGTSFQIIGISTCVRGTNCSLLLDICELGIDLSGNALAKSIVDTIYTFYEPDEAKRLYLGCAVDGQYILLHVPNKILKLLGFDVDRSCVTPSFHHTWWDSAHVIELANSDMQSRFPWINEIENIIKEVNAKYKYGKGHAELHQEAQRRAMTAASIGSSSDTRFAAHEFKVLRNFHKNFQFIYAILNSKDDPNLARIASMRFVILFSGLTDFYKIISEASCQVQNSTSFPWECDNAVLNMVTKLRSMAQYLKTDNYGYENDLLVYTNKCCKELILHQTFQDSALFRNRVYIHYLRSNPRDTQPNVAAVIRENAKKIAEFYESYCCRMEERLNDMKNQESLNLGKQAFSLQSILNTPIDDKVSAFQQYCELAIFWGFIPNIKLEEITQAYIQFLDVCKTLFETTATTNGYQLGEKEFWQKLILCNEYSVEVLPYSKDVIHLLLTALVRNKSECIAETVGSLIKGHLPGRGSLSNDAMRQELFLDFNGPPPHRECHRLVKKALLLRFADSSFHFKRRSSTAKLNSYETSRVADRCHLTLGRIPPPED